MALHTAQLTVGTTRVRLDVDATDNRADSSIAVTAPAAATLYIGSATVTAATGFPVPAGTTISVDLQYREHLYGVLASGSGTVSVLATGV